MERKKGIPLVALIIFVALLVAIILTCIIILGANKNKKNNNNPEVSPVTQVPETTPEPVEDETGEEITSEDYINNDSTIKDAYKLTGNQKTYAKYAIYSSGGFDSDNNNIKNELKLQLAVAQVTNQDMDKESSTKSVGKDKIEGYVKKIFEDSSVDLKDFSLYNSDTTFTREYRTIGYKYNDNTESYEVQESDVEEDYPPEITEVITKAVKYNSKLEIYVKPIFIRPFFSDDINDMGCELFNEYDFSLRDFPEENALGAFVYSEFEKVLKSDYNSDLDGYNYSSVEKYVDLNAIDEYKYTFTKDKDGFKLKSFERASFVPEKKQDTSEPLTAQEKAVFNSQIENYIGNDMSGSETRSLLDTIIALNENNSDRTDMAVAVSVDGIKVELEDDDITTLNEEIEELRERINTTDNYSIKATYKSGVITTVTITTK